MSEKSITSPSNPIIKKIRGLAQKKNRDDEKLFVAEGLRHILEAIDAGWRMDLIAYTPKAKDHPLTLKAIQAAQAQKATCLEVHPDVLSKVTSRENAQSVVAVFHQKWAESRAILDSAKLVVALDNVRDPGNLGTILRTGDAAGVDGYILIGACCDPFSQEAIRASMGSFARAKIAKTTEGQIIKDLAAWNGLAIGTHLNATHDYRDPVLYKARAMMILMGNEQAGLSDGLAGACRHLVRIPMQGGLDSLNLSIASAIMMYEAYRQRSMPPATG